MMSMTGFAASPGTAVLPTCSMPPTTQLPITRSRIVRSCSKRVGQDSSYGTMWTGCSGIGVIASLASVITPHRKTLILDSQQTGDCIVFHVDCSDTNYHTALLLQQFSRRLDLRPGLDPLIHHQNACSGLDGSDSQLQRFFVPRVIHKPSHVCLD